MGCRYSMYYAKYSDTLLSFAPKNEEKIEPIEYKSKSDEDLSIIESKYNYLYEIQLVHYINVLEDFNLNNATLSYDAKQIKTSFSFKDFNVPMDKSLFQSFIENKLTKLDELYNNQKEDDVNSYKKINLLELHGSLNIKLKQYLQITDESEIKQDIIHKKHLIPLGVLFTESDVLGKVKLIFDLFKEGEVFQNSNDFNEYLISSFLLSSYCLVSSGNKLFKENKEIFSKFDKNYVIDLVRIYSLDNCKTLLEEFIGSFFSDENPFEWENFRQKFEGKEGFQWILSSNGIRSKLESIEEGKNHNSESRE